MTDQPRNRRAVAPNLKGRRAIAGGDTRRGGGLRRIPELLGRILDPAARRRGLAEAKLLTEWPTIVGARLAARCQPVRLAGAPDHGGGILHLHVGGAAALELQHSEPQIIERINGFFGYPAVVRLRLVQAPRPAVAKRPAAAPQRPLSAAETAAVADAVRGIGDPALQAALEALGRALKTRVDDAGRETPLAGLSG